MVQRTLQRTIEINNLKHSTNSPKMAFYNKNFFKIPKFSNQARVLLIGAGLLGGYTVYRTQNPEKQAHHLATISSLNLKNVEVVNRQNCFSNLFQLENCSNCSTDNKGLPKSAMTELQVFYLEDVFCCYIGDQGNVRPGVQFKKGH